MSQIFASLLGERRANIYSLAKETGSLPQGDATFFFDQFRIYERETEREKNRLCEINQFITQHLHAFLTK